MRKRGILNCTIKTTISDHEAVYLIKKKIRCKPLYTQIRARTYQNYDKAVFQNDIRNDDQWLSFSSTSDVNVKWEIFERIIENHADVHCPQKNIKVRTDSPQWFTKELLEEIYHRDRLYKNAKFTNNVADWNLYKKKRNEVKGLLLQAREEYVKGKLEEDKNDPKKIWRSINKLTGFGKNKNKKGLSVIKLESGEILKGIEAANYMNKHYTNAGSNLASKFDDNWDVNDSTIESNGTFSFSFITEQSISKLVSEIKISKSSAMGSLGSRLLRDAFEVCTLELTDLYNRCLDTSDFPDNWGIGEITPIPKVNINNLMMATYYSN